MSICKLTFCAAAAALLAGTSVASANHLRPDLVISAASQRSFTVTNIGNAPTGRGFRVRVPTVGTFGIPALAAGASATRDISWGVCDHDSWGPLTITADSTNVVAEPNELNNSRRADVLC